MSEAEKGADLVRRAAEREHSGARHVNDRRKADQDAAAAHPRVTNSELRKGRPPDGDWRDKPVDTERDKDIKAGGIEGAARRQRGRV